MATAGELTSEAATTLFDETGVRWTETELIGYLNDAQKLVCLLKPIAYTLNVPVQLVPGPLQSIPAGGTILVDVLYNLGAGGATPGRGITQIARKLMESYRPSWRSDPAAGEVKHFVFDERDPTHFEVYPSQPSPAHYIQISHAAVPPDLEDPDDDVLLSPVFHVPMKFMVLSSAYTKSSSSQDFGRAASYMAIAQQMITGRKVTASEIHPRETQERAAR